MSARWMVCNARGEPCGFLSYATQGEAERAADATCGGLHGYHARPVEITIVVRGQGPQPWCHRVMADGRTVDL